MILMMKIHNPFVKITENVDPSSIRFGSLGETITKYRPIFLKYAKTMYFTIISFYQDKICQNIFLNNDLTLA